MIQKIEHFFCIRYYQEKVEIKENLNKKTIFSQKKNGSTKFTQAHE